MTIEEATVVSGAGPTVEDEERARRVVCATAESAEEASLLLKMLGLL